MRTAELRDSDSEQSEAVDAAIAGFQETASQQLKGLMAHGIDGGAASAKLMDELLQQRGSREWKGDGCSTQGASGRPESPVGVWGSPDLQHVVESTGFSPTQAARTLLLREEITSLRRQGHTTATVIEQLNRRLRNAARIRKSESVSYENTGQPSHRTQAKKLKLSDDLAITSFSPPPRPAQRLSSPTQLEGFLRPGRFPSEKRLRDEPPLLTPLAAPSAAQLKKLKLAATSRRPSASS